MQPCGSGCLLYTIVFFVFVPLLPQGLNGYYYIGHIVTATWIVWLLLFGSYGCYYIDRMVPNPYF